MKELERAIGARVKLARTKMKITQEQLAEKVEKSVETISNIERGLVLPAIDTLLQIASALQVDITNLIGDSKYTGLSKHRSQKRIELEARLQSITSSMNDYKLEMFVKIGGIIVEK